MKKLPSIKALSRAIVVVVFVFGIVTCFRGYLQLEFHNEVNHMGSYLRANKNQLEEPLEEDGHKVSETQKLLEVPLAYEVVPEIVYDGMTLEELGEKLERSLKSTLIGYGQTFASFAIEYQVDPYIALAIVFLETGCYSGTCSALASQCNNFGGMKGGPGCGGKSYQRFATPEEGLRAFIENLSINYYQKGLTSVEQIGKKYAESNTWATKVNNYILKIKAN